MPQYRADYIVKSDLVFPLGAPPETLGSAAQFSIVLLNAPLDHRGHTPHLIAEVVGRAPDLESVDELFRAQLADSLNVLSMVTRSICYIDQCTRVIEWEPFQKSRLMRPMVKINPFDPPTP